MKEFGPLMDVHVHINDIGINNAEVASFFNKKMGDVRWNGVSVERHAEHIKNNNLEVIYAIYENPATLISLRKAASDCDVKGMYFVRNVENPDKKYIRRLFKKGLIQGLKVHPVIDNFPLTGSSLNQVLALAREFSVPLLYHSDDRTKYWELTAPHLQEILVGDNPDIKFIIGHGGAYAHPRLVGSHPAVKTYWEGTEKIVSRKYLVFKALQLSYRNDNVFYDLTVTTNSVKAGIIRDFIQGHPGVSEKILVGTDFPINRAKTTSQLESLAKTGLKAAIVQKIASNRI